MEIWQPFIESELAGSTAVPMISPVMRFWPGVQNRDQINVLWSRPHIQLESGELSHNNLDTLV